LIVPTVRSEAKSGEALKVTVIAIDHVPMTQVALHWRRWRQSTFQTIAAHHLGRAVYEVSLPAEGDDLEYYVSARTSKGNEVVWPATGPQICQTVIRIP
jgi:hypothetical protein